LKKHFISSIYIVGVMLLYVSLIPLGEIISYMYCYTVTSRAKKE